MKSERYRIKPGSRVNLKDLNPASHAAWSDRDLADAASADLIKNLAGFQNRLYAERERSLLVIIQGMDTSGKDGLIRHVLSGINPQGCSVTSFKAPTAEEAAHDFLWRIHPRVPAKGMVGIFNRSHYEDVCITRVHKWISKDEAQRRLKVIHQFEKHLSDSGTTIVKFFLHISKDEQKRRLQKRIDNPEKRWKFNPGDLAERGHWGDYRRAYETLMEATSEDHAPWYVVPADNKWYRNWVVASVMAKTFTDMKLKTPKPDPKIDFKKIRIS